MFSITSLQHKCSARYSTTFLLWTCKCYPKSPLIPDSTLSKKIANVIKKMKKANTIITMNAIVLLLQRISISSDRRTLNVIKFQAFPYSYYSHDKKGTYPYYISPNEIGLL